VRDSAGERRIEFNKPLSLVRDGESGRSNTPARKKRSCSSQQAKSRPAGDSSQSHALTLVSSAERGGTRASFLRKRMGHPPQRHGEEADSSDRIGRLYRGFARMNADLNSAFCKNAKRRGGALFM
jgi:hypothetical protein